MSISIQILINLAADVIVINGLKKKNHALYASKHQITAYYIVGLLNGCHLIRKYLIYGDGARVRVA